MQLGQAQIVEQVILFGVGLAIALGFLTAFETFGRDVKDRAIEEQMRLNANLISSHVGQLIQTGAEGSLRFRLSPSIANEDYSVNFTDSGVAVRVGDKTHLSTSLNGLEEQYDLQGRVTSGRETAEINVGGRDITIEGS